MSVCLSTFVCLCMCLCICVSLCVCIYVAFMSCLPLCVSMCASLCVHLCMCWYASVCICVFLCVCTCVCLFACMCVCEGGRGGVGRREGFACMQVLSFLKTFLYHQGPRGCGIIDVFSRYFPNGAAEMPWVNHLF